MLTHHEPNDFTSLSAEERATIVQAVIRRAHAARAEAVRDIAKRLFRLAGFRRGTRGGNAPGTPANYARHA
jgi:hypothetical protein